MREPTDDDVLAEREGHVATIEIRRPPNNFIDRNIVGKLAGLLERLDEEEQCRVVVLASQGKHFCAGADLAGRLRSGMSAGHIYDEAPRLVRTHKPVIAAVQGAAVGAGLGLALLADFRVGSDASSFSANFSRQGYHPGFGLSFTLPRLVGPQHATWMFYSSERVKGDRALAMGLIDRLVPEAEIRQCARGMAHEIAASGPLAVQSIRRALRADYESRFCLAIQQEMLAQDGLLATEDYKEGVRAMVERRVPQFKGR